MRLLLAVWVLNALILNAQQSTVHVREDNVSLPTYDEGEPDPNPQFPAFFNDYFPNYPYTIRTPSNKLRHMTQWRVLILENEYLSCRILPDLGGHLHGCIDKISGREMFYANPAVRRGPENARGAFVAMGIESSFPIAHSRVGSSPVDFAISESGGIGRVIVEDTDRVSGMTWRDEFILRPGSALLEQRVTLHNGTETRRGFHWWANAAIEIDDPHLRFIYPVNWMLPHGPTGMTSWPVNGAGIDLSDLANHKEAVGLFAHGSYEPWMAIYKPKFRSGLVHYANAGDVKGKKLWLWGPDDKYVKENLTENFNSYVEMQAGIMETQPEFAFLFPGETRSFTHFWIPVRDMGGISRATPDAVVNLTRNSQGATIELTATHSIRGARILLMDGPKKLFETRIDLGAEDEVPEDCRYQRKRPTVELLDDTGARLLEYMDGDYDSRPFDPKGSVPDPQPPAPGAESEADVIARGSFNEQRDQFAFAWKDYRIGLAKYPASERIILGAGRTAFALNRFDEAVPLLAALAVRGKLPEASWYYGAALAATGHVAEAKAEFYKAALDIGYKEPALFRIALLAAAQNHMAEAVQTIQLLKAGSGAFEVAILRRAGKPDAARDRLKFWLDSDPADNMLRAERILLGLPDDPAFWNHLAGDPERILNLADSYFSLGAYDDALRFLDRQYAPVPATETEPGAVLPQNHALLVYYRGYARSGLGQDSAADFKTASALPILYIFPSRASSLDVLKAALQKNDSDATAHALTGDLAMASLDTDVAIMQWRKALALKSDLPAIRAALERALAEVGKPPAAASVATALPAPRVEVTARPVELPPVTPTGDIAGDALVRAALNPDPAALAFTNANFPKEKQPEEVRRAYIEVQMQRLFVRAETGRCEEAMSGLDTLGDELKDLTFTMYGFGLPMKAAHFQYLLGLIESACGADKAATKRWSKVSRSNEPPDSFEFVFPLLAARSLNEAGWQKRIAAALQSLKGAATTTVFARGALLIAAGRLDEGDALLLETARTADPMLRYLSLVIMRVSAKAFR